jgi:predicted nuclease of predicted toxin-antitoxin system
MFLIDNNLSNKLILKLEAVFPGIQHVEHYDLDESDDLAVWDFARSNALHILTKLDFWRKTAISSPVLTL